MSLTGVESRFRPERHEELGQAFPVRARELTRAIRGSARL